MTSLGKADSDKGKPLFQDMKFWLSASIPQRSFLKGNIEKYGGRVETLEADADIRLVDHTRREVAPDTYSYQFVEKSIRKGTLQDLENFRVGQPSGSVRAAGSTTIPAKSHRTPFSARDDQILFDWMKPLEDAGGKISGRKIYESLEQKHPHHTWQSWRERYIKKIRGLPRPAIKGQERKSPTPKPPTSQENGAQDSISDTQSPYASFTKSDKEELLKNAKNILQVDPTQEDDCWTERAENSGTHSATEWKNYFHACIRPLHEAKIRRKRASQKLSPETKTHRNTLTAATTLGNCRPSELSRGSNIDQQTYDGDNSRKEESNLAQEASRKRRRTLPPSIKSGPSVEAANDSPRKRRTTDYISREAPTTLGRIAEQRTSLSPLNPPSPRRYNTGKQPLRPSPNHFSSKVKGKQPSKRQRTSTDPLESEEEDFETAPQFPGLETIFSQPTQHDDELNPFIDNSYSELHTTLLADLELPEEEKEQVQELDDWVSSRARREGLNEKQVIEALECTSMNTSLADTVLKYIKAGKGIPSNMKGVWTKQDDEAINGVDSREIEAVYKKHGKENVDSRFGYFEIVNDLLIEEAGE